MSYETEETHNARLEDKPLSEKVHIEYSFINKEEDLEGWEVINKEDVASALQKVKEEFLDNGEYRGWDIHMKLNKHFGVLDNQSSQSGSKMIDNLLNAVNLPSGSDIRKGCGKFIPNELSDNHSQDLVATNRENINISPLDIKKEKGLWIDPEILRLSRGQLTEEEWAEECKKFEEVKK